MHRKSGNTGISETVHDRDVAVYPVHSVLDRLFYRMQWIDYIITFVSVCVRLSVKFVNTSVVERLRPRFFTDFHQIMQ